MGFFPLHISGILQEYNFLTNPDKIIVLSKPASALPAKIKKRTLDWFYQQAIKKEPVSALKESIEAQCETELVDVDLLISGSIRSRHQIYRQVLGISTWLTSHFRIMALRCQRRAGITFSSDR